MDHQNPSAPECAQVNHARRLVAVGITRHHGGRTTRITATPTGVTGSIRPAVTR